MEELKKSALQLCLHLLTKNMLHTEILGFLISKNIFTFLNVQKIEEYKTDYGKNFCLVEMITKSRPEAFELFIEALNESNQEHPAKDILNALENLQQNGDNNSNDFPPTKRLKEAHDASEMDFDCLNAAQSSLKDLYISSFKEVHPFSQSFFTFHIKKTWISLSLRTNWSDGEQQNAETRIMDDHIQLIKEAFQEGKQLLLIEGKPASGKTSLMRRIAYDWAVGQLDVYNVVFYVEFRKIRRHQIQTFVELIQDGFDPVQDQNIKQLTDQIKNPNFCKEIRVLVLLDGLDEANFETPCVELSNYLEQRGLIKKLLFNVIVTTRPTTRLSKHLQRNDILNTAKVLGFDTKVQKSAYIQVHFHATKDSEQKKRDVEKCLKESLSLRKIAETPLFLVFICLLYDKLEKKTVFELYKCIVWWLIDRYQADHPMINIPSLFGFCNATDKENWRIIQDHYLEFPLLRKLGKMAFELHDKKTVFQTLIWKNTK